MERTPRDGWPADVRADAEKEGPSGALRGRRSPGATSRVRGAAACERARAANLEGVAGLRGRGSAPLEADGPPGCRASQGGWDMALSDGKPSGRTETLTGQNAFRRGREIRALGWPTQPGPGRPRKPTPRRNDFVDWTPERGWGGGAWYAPEARRGDSCEVTGAPEAPDRRKGLYTAGRSESTRALNLRAVRLESAVAPTKPPALRDGKPAVHRGAPRGA